MILHGIHGIVLGIPYLFHHKKILYKENNQYLLVKDERQFLEHSYQRKSEKPLMVSLVKNKINRNQDLISKESGGLQNCFPCS